MSLPTNFFIGRGGGGWTPYTFTQANFEHGGLMMGGGSTGRFGPSLQQVKDGLSGTYTDSWKHNTDYLYVGSNGVIQWTVPDDGNYTFDVRGARGGLAGGSSSGHGARIVGTFSLTGGDKLKMVVGQAGAANHGGAGGGGSFVVTEANNTPLIIAGGGGGSGSGGGDNGNSSEAGSLAAGQTGTSGSRGSNSYDTGGAGGTNGGAGGYGSSNWSGGPGAGFLNHQATNAVGSHSGAYGFSHPTYPSLGGRGYDNQCEGGFGGGGGGGQYGAGGGGGYSGGGNSTRHCVAGGGGSYNAGTNKSQWSHWQNTDGVIYITKV